MVNSCNTLLVECNFTIQNSKNCTISILFYSNPDSPGAPNNDHNYTLSPGTSSASSAASTPVNNSNRSDTNANLNNIDIAQLNNHIGK